jgi:hypothetical protein
MRTGRIVVVIIGALLAMVGFTAGVGGGALMVAHATQRDSGGFYATAVEQFQTPTAALVAFGELRLPDSLAPETIGRVRVEATAPDGGALFLGIAPRAQVENWLAGSAYERVVGARYAPSFEADTELVTGAQAVPKPQEQAFWVASAAGPGIRTITWTPQDGTWALVVMNADAAPGVVADVSIASDTEALLPLGGLLAILGGMLFAGGLAVMLLALATRRDAAQSGAAAAAYGLAEPAGDPTAYPVRLDARLDAPLSRWMWLVKWFLAIPHVIVLVLLWLAVLPLTAVAGVAILFTGRYPRAIFDFNVGVFRWTWRVGYYAFSALGTDRYPPFSLDPDPAYPADLAVPYPQRLSRGLVLVKWWLLAIPHYLIVALFVGGWAGWTGGAADGGGWRYSVAGGLIGLLVIVAMVVLLFTGRYPQPVFDFVLGMDRWAYRVLAYAALMRDEYPPFRLDNGGTDPGSLPRITVPPPPPPPQVPPERAPTTVPDRTPRDVAPARETRLVDAGAGAAGS